MGGTSLFPAKREVKREVAKAWQAWPRNQTSCRCLVRCLVWGAPSPGRPNGMSAAMLSCGPTPSPNGEAPTVSNDSRGRTSGECGWAPSRAQVGARGRHTFLEGSAPGGGGGAPQRKRPHGALPFSPRKGKRKGKLPKRGRRGQETRLPPDVWLEVWFRRRGATAAQASKSGPLLKRNGVLHGSLLAPFSPF